MSITPGDRTGAGAGIPGQFIPTGAVTPPPVPAGPGPQPNLGPSAQPLNNTSWPPVNGTLVYSPDCRILIAHNGKQFDISADIVRGTVLRKENAASTLIWECHNKGLRYTNGTVMGGSLFYRMDRVTCYMKRGGDWIQVFSGYLDSVPFLQIYPAIVSFKATCTLKRLLCYWWNPGLQDSLNFFNQQQYSPPGGSPDPSNPNSKYGDTGLSQMLFDLLTKVGHWDPSTVHIQRFPSGFMDLLRAQMNKQPTDRQAGEYFRQLIEGTSANNPTPAQNAGYNPGAGLPGPINPGGGTAFYVSQIVQACDACGMGPNTTNIKLSSGLSQAATAGEGSRDQASRTDAQQTQQVAQNYKTAMTNQDAAIIGAAVAMVETGGGNQIVNYANAGNQESLNLPHDAVGHDGSSVGIFQQQDGGAWGTTAERMNPRQAATMFFNALQKYQWQNMDPGVAGWDVQRAGDQAGYEAKVDAAIPLATQYVQQYRNSTAAPGSAATSAVTSSLPVQQTTALAPVLGNNPTLTTALNSPTSSPTVILTSGPGGGTPGPSGPKAPSNLPYDSEGAINFCYAQIGKPYVWGGTGPAGYDCSGLMQAAFHSIGLEIGRDTTSQAGKGQRIMGVNAARGDTIQPQSTHTTMWLGDGTIIEASTPGVPIHRVKASFSPSSAYGVFRFCSNGGPNPAAPFNPAAGGGGNTPLASPSTVLASEGSVNGAASGGSSEQIAMNLFTYMFDPSQFISETAAMFGMMNGEKDFINAQPLMQAVAAICGGGLRSFASAPNGDFIAYYPDFFGMDGKPAVFILEDVELKDLTLNFSDDALATHVYVNGAVSMVGEMDATLGWLLTMGYATVENTELYERMRKVAPGDLETMTGKQLMARFGVRPVQVEYALTSVAEMEFLLAVRLFMEKWSAQYQSSISMTFMPDLFPGMRVLCQGHSVQFYVNEVTHQFDFEHGFHTSAIVSSPSNPFIRNLWNAPNTPDNSPPPAQTVVNPGTPGAPIPTVVST